MSELPTGTVTILFTDIEGSTRLWKQQPAALEVALARRHALLTDGIRQQEASRPGAGAKAIASSRSSLALPALQRLKRALLLVG